MRVFKVVVVALSCAAGALALAGSASADGPSNDAFSGATVISSVPYNTTEDTTGATLDATDNAVLNACNAGGFSFSASVWFAYTPSSDQTVQVQTDGSSYATGTGVVTGSPSSFSAVSCSFGDTSFHANAGTTYYIDVSEQGGGLDGGTLNLSLTPLVPPTATLTVDKFGEFDSVSGAATISGTASCSAGAFAFLDGSLGTTPVGRLAAISGFGYPFNGIVCDGTTHPWSFVVTPASGLFKGGPANADVSMFVCSYGCTFPEVRQTITLRH